MTVKQFVQIAMLNLTELINGFNDISDLGPRVMCEFTRKYIIELAQKLGVEVSLEDISTLTDKDLKEENMEIKVRRLENYAGGELAYATEGSAGFDIPAGKGQVVVPAHGRTLVKTGFAVAVPDGYELQIRPRSGLALKKGITVLNTPGTIDSDYRGEVGVVLFNTTDEDFVVNEGDRIAQGVINKVEKGEFVYINELESTERNNGGFGSTGVS